jgi:hypothetical protein
VHRQPTICFYTGYLPAHVSMIERLIAALPEAAALDDLVDMTQLRWIVLRPEREWPSPELYRRHVDGLRTHPRVRATTPAGDFTLVELDPTSRHPTWYASLAEGPRRGFSALGTPLVRLPASARAAMRVDVPARVLAGAPLDVTVALENRGSLAWPAAAPARPGVPYSVRLELTWVDPDRAAESPATSELRRDVPAGDDLVQTVTVPAPPRFGRRRLTVVLRQVDGPELDTREVEVEVEAARDGSA